MRIKQNLLTAIDKVWVKQTKENVWVKKSLASNFHFKTKDQH